MHDDDIIAESNSKVKNEQHSRLATGQIARCRLDVDGHRKIESGRCTRSERST